MKSRLSSFIKNKMPRTLRGNFLLITISLMLVFGMGASVMSYIMFSDNLRANSLHSSETNLQFMCNEIDTNLNSVYDLAFWSQTNTAISSYISTSPDDNYYSALTKNASERLTEEYLGTAAYQYIPQIIITNADGTKYLQKYSSASYSTDRGVISTIKSLPYYEDLMNAADYTFSVGVQNNPFSRTTEKVVPLLRPVESAYSREKIGILFIQISFSLFTDPLSRFSVQEELPVYLTICDENYRIEGKKLSQVEQSSNAKIIEHPDTASSDAIVHKNLFDSGLYVSLPLDADGCYISLPVDLNNSGTSLSGFLAILLLILIFIIVIGLLLIRLLNHSVTKPVTLLKKQLSVVAAGDFAPNPDIEWNNELGDIGHEINLLAEDISNLMEEKIANEKEKKDQEYRILQSQINPHFLYNTLNSIKWMATAQRAEGIAEMTTALAHLLKSIAKGTASIVSVETEFQLLDDYFTIQKYRYGGTVTMEYQIDDPSLLQNQILRFTLQPIVENAIFHGIEPKGSSGHILIHLFLTEKGDVRIDITDDGIGMDEATIRSVLSGETSGRSSFFKQIGIENVNKRILYTFGSAYGLSITSTPGEFTCMSIVLPKKKAAQSSPDQKE